MSLRLLLCFYWGTSEWPVLGHTSDAVSAVNRLYGAVVLSGTTIVPFLFLVVLEAGTLIRPILDLLNRFSMFLTSPPIFFFPQTYLRASLQLQFSQGNFFLFTGTKVMQASLLAVTCYIGLVLIQMCFAGVAFSIFSHMQGSLITFLILRSLRIYSLPPAHCSFQSSIMRLP